MGVIRTCNNCGHEQMLGYNPVDGRVQWWTQCKKCKHGDFMAPLDPALIDMLAKAHGKVNPDA